MSLQIRFSSQALPRVLPICIATLKSFNFPAFFLSTVFPRGWLNGFSQCIDQGGCEFRFPQRISSINARSGPNQFDLRRNGRV